MSSSFRHTILSMDAYKNCRLCPRQCGADRTQAHSVADPQAARRLPGYCGCTDHVKVARAALHMWEEPCISGPAESGSHPSEFSGADISDSTSGNSYSGADISEGTGGIPAGGSGAVFFSGCTLGCIFCQNYKISHGGFGKEISVPQLADIFLRLQDQGAYNLNLITATQYLPSVVAALDQVRDRLTIPVVYNCGGYERTEIIQSLRDYVDIWLPDLKYMDSVLSAGYSRAGDYFRQASGAVMQMISQTGAPVLDSRGLMKSGVIIRHMVLPGARRDSIRLLHWIKENLPAGKYYLSLMSQYTPAGEAASHPQLNRRITTYEYESVLDTALKLGLTTGYMQKKSSAREEYTPPFNLEGV